MRRTGIFLLMLALTATAGAQQNYGGGIAAPSTIPGQGNSAAVVPQVQPAPYTPAPGQRQVQQGGTTGAGAYPADGIGTYGSGSSGTWGDSSGYGNAGSGGYSTGSSTTSGSYGTGGSGTGSGGYGTGSTSTSTTGGASASGSPFDDYDPNAGGYSSGPAGR